MTERSKSQPPPAAADTAQLPTGGAANGAAESLLQHVLDLIEAAGPRVIPLHSPLANGGCSCRRASCASQGKHPRDDDWPNIASADPKQVAAWWTRWPQANIGIVCGAASGIVVIDVDGPTGAASLAELERVHGAPPLTVRALTGGGGTHYYFAHPGTPIGNKKLALKVDVRGDRGQVVAPPSTHRSGVRYLWAPGCALGEIPLAPLPQWIIDALRRPERKRSSTPPPRDSSASPYLRRAVEREVEAMRSASEGRRNHQLNLSAFNLGQLVAGADLDAQLVRVALRRAALDVGLGELEARRTIESGLAGGAKDPRRAPESGTGNGHAPASGGGAERPSGQYLRSDWPEPIPVELAHEVPEFPVDTLPGWLRDWVIAEAHATQTPRDMAAMLALCTVATACARRLRVHVRGDWYEPPNIFACVVLPPGSRKSTVFRAALAPLDAYECAQAEGLAVAIAHSQDAVTRAQKRHARLIDIAVKTTHPAERLAAEEDVREAREQLQIAEKRVIVAPRLTCSDITQEALARLLEQHGEKIAVVDAEGCGPIALMLGRYSDGASSVDLYLRGHAGDQYRADRVGRDPVILRAPRVTLAVTVQPEVLRQLGGRRELRGLGLLARILWCVPTSTVGHRDSEPDAMSPAVATGYAHNIRALLELPAAQDGAAHPVRLSAEAWTELRRLIDRTEPELGAGGELGYMADWAGKLCGAVARIAGLLHAAQYPREPWLIAVSGDTMTQAVAIGDYLLAHARAALSIIGADPEVASAAHVLTWLRGHCVQGSQSSGEPDSGAKTTGSVFVHTVQNVHQIGRRELHRALRGRFPKATDMDAALTVLIERGWIRLQEVVRKGRGRTPSPLLLLNPQLLDTLDGLDRNRERVSFSTTTSRSGEPSDFVSLGHNGHNGHNASPAGGDA